MAGEGLKITPHMGLRDRQISWLKKCLARNQRAAYLKTYGVDGGSSPEEFGKRLPFVTYDELTSNIERIERGEAGVLFEGEPIAFERTSGNSGGNKLIPYTLQSLEDFRAAILPWLADVINIHKIESGCAYWAISPATRPSETTSAGIQVGLSDGAYLGDDVLPAFVGLSAVPAWVGAIQDVGEWKNATLYWLLCRDDLVLISVWSPTFFQMLMDALEKDHAILDKLLREGGNINGHWLPSNEQALKRLRAYRDSLDAKILWPALKMVSCWADASSRPFYNNLKKRLPHAQFQGKGLLSTEGVTTVPGHLDIPVLAADSGFFEFLDTQGLSCFAWELQSGAQYEVVMTTSGGLYRYRTGDLVKCEGYSENLPLLRFQGRNGLVSDIVGEKLTEQFVDSCLQDIAGFRMLVPRMLGKPGYVLILDEQTGNDCKSLVATIEKRLMENSQYEYARRIGQLDLLEVLPVRNPTESFMARMTHNGARLGDIKVPSLRSEPDWLKTFTGAEQ